MTARAFIDRTGSRWTVTEVPAADAASESRERRAEPRSVTRGARKAQVLSTRPLALTSLLFECRAERRRLTPAPNDWRTLPPDELEDLLPLTTLDTMG